MKFTTRPILLSAENGLPTEFRLFVKGWNITENGQFLFDDTAAQKVMSAYQAWGVDVSIDLDHQMLEVAPGAPDPTARDARGWCKLELRSDGSLWAVAVSWTPDGVSRLQEKRQRYVSPAFEIDPKTKRVTKIINIALVALPATHNTPALVAASARGTDMLDADHVKKALDALQAGDDEAAAEILKAMIADAASGGEAAEGDEPGDEGDGAEGVAPPEKESVEDPEVKKESADAADGDSDDDEDSDRPEKKAARKLLRAALCRLTGKASLAEAVAEVEVYKASHVALETERQKLAKERAILESAERRRLVTELVRLGAEFPATVWADSSAAKPSKLKARWADMPIAELRSHVSEQQAARGKKPASKGGVRPAATLAATTSEPDISTLSADELRFCKEAGADPKDYALLKARRDGATAQEGGR